MLQELRRPADFNELILRLYRLSQELPIQYFQDAALMQIKAVLPFDSSMWGTATTKPDGLEIHTVHLFEESPDMLVDYDKVKHQDIAASAVFGKARVTHSFNTDSSYATPERKDMLDFMHRFKHENFFVSAETAPSQNFIHWISLYRAGKNAFCSEGECQFLSQLAPHVVQALAFNRVIHLDKLGAADRTLSPYGSAIVDARGMIYHADPQFRELAQEEWNDWDGVALPTGLLDKLRLNSERFTGCRMMIRQYVEHGLLFLKARRRCLADKLLPREQTIARAIAQGQSYKEIARVLGRSPATVRNQIQTIYEKLQVNSIATLIEALRQAY